jgi:hypothetical protein
MVFSVMAFIPAAQAQQWTFAEREGGAKLVPFLEALLLFEADATWVMHTKIAGIAVLVSCTTIQAVNAKLKANGSIGSGAKVRFSGCITQLNGMTSHACEPNPGGIDPGVVTTNELHGLLKGELISILPDTGSTFSTLEMSEECPIGEKVPVFGTLTLKDGKGQLKSHLVKHLLEVGSKAEGTQLWTISQTAEHETFILGSRWAFLGGIHTGLKFSGE